MNPITINTACQLYVEDPAIVDDCGHPKGQCACGYKWYEHMLIAIPEQFDRTSARGLQLERGVIIDPKKAAQMLTEGFDRLFVDPKLARLEWDWIGVAPKGFMVELTDGYAAARMAAKYYGRKIRQNKLKSGDYRITIIV